MKTSVLPLNFFVLQIAGFWRPLHWSSLLKISIYNFYSYLMWFLLYSVTVSQLIEIVRSPGTVDEVINQSRVLLTMVNACVKSLIFITRRGDILKAIDIIASPPCSPRNAAEAVIQEKYDKSLRRNSFIYGAVIQTSVYAWVIQTAMESIPNRILPFECWFPYENNSDLTYWLTYVHQTLGSAWVTPFLNICHDTIVPGCMIQTCAQLQIFKSRLKDFCEHKDEKQTSETTNELEYDDSVDKKLVSDCVEYHLKILKFAELSNNIFTYSIFTQFGISSLVICVSVYDLSKSIPFSPHFVEVIIYLGSMMVQLYVYCFYGNKVTIESSRIGGYIYDLDWVSLKMPVQKSLLIIMLRSMKPLIFTSGHVVVLSLTSFTSLLKMSYSAYNVLEQSS